MAKTYTTVVDRAVGDRITEAIWDAQIRDNINNLLVPPSVMLRHSANQTVTTSTNTDKAFDTEDFDNDGAHDTATNNQRITPTTAGLYIFEAGIAWTTGTTGYRAVYLMKNSTDFIASTIIPASAGAYEQSVCRLESMNGSGDYAKVLVVHTNGSDVTVNASATSAERRTHFGSIWVAKSS